MLATTEVIAGYNLSSTDIGSSYKKVCLGEREDGILLQSY